MQQQHDVQEFCQALLSIISQELQNTPQANFINDPYEGTSILLFNININYKIINVILCIIQEKCWIS